jgi:hypothetical protein
MFRFSKPDRTDITVILDRSGSMQSVYGQTVEGFEAFVDKQKHLPGNCRLTLVQFDTVYEVVYRSKPIHRVPRLKLKPRGATALLDALGRTIRETASRVERLTESQQPARLIIVIITDGLENSSREYTRKEVFSLVRQYTLSADWQFVFLGANQDAILEASQMGIDAGAAMTYTADVQGTAHAWQAAADAVVRHRRCGRTRVAGSYFTDDERRAARGGAG